MTSMGDNEQYWLAWVEGELDPVEARALQEQLQSDPELLKRLMAMRLDRERFSALPIPAPPSDFLQRVETAMTRPMLAIPAHTAPGRFRRRKHRSDVRMLLQRRLRLAAMIALAIGICTLAVRFNPFANIFSVSDTVTSSSPTGDWLATSTGMAPTQRDPLMSTAPIEEVVLPEPLAMLVGSDTDVLTMLRETALQVGCTLVRNASPADFNQNGLSASSSSSGEGREGEVDLEPTLMLGDADQAPSFEDQFLYADAGSVYTITVPLSQLDLLLAALDERAGADASVLLLDDYLKKDVSPDWIRTIRARRAVSSWTRTEDDPMIVVPIFIK